MARFAIGGPRFLNLKEKPSSTEFMRWRITPPPQPDVLQRATKKGLKAANQALPSSGRVRVVGSSQADDTATLVQVEVTLHAIAADPDQWLPRCKAAFALAFEDATHGEHRVYGVPPTTPLRGDTTR